MKDTKCLYWRYHVYKSLLEPYITLDLNYDSEKGQIITILLQNTNDWISNLKVFQLANRQAA